jgi:hypothetical protein
MTFFPAQAGFGDKDNDEKVSAQLTPPPPLGHMRLIVYSLPDRPVSFAP